VGVRAVGAGEEEGGSSGPAVGGGEEIEREGAQGGCGEARARILPDTYLALFDRASTAGCPTTSEKPERGLRRKLADPRPDLGPELQQRRPQRSSGRGSREEGSGPRAELPAAPTETLREREIARAGERESESERERERERER
jgi:hypothetical protein